MKKVASGIKLIFYFSTIDYAEIWVSQELWFNSWRRQGAHVFLLNVHSGFGAHPATCSLGTGVLSLEEGGGIKRPVHVPHSAGTQN